MKRSVRNALLLVNTFGALGYFTMVIAWTLFAAATLLLLVESSVIPLPSYIPAQDAVHSSAGEFVVLSRILVAVITIIMAVLTLCILVLLPYIIGKWGARIMRRLMKWCHVALTRRNLFLAKGIVITVPLLGFVVITLVYAPFDMMIPAAHIATIFLSLLSLSCNLLQVVSARSLNVAVKDMW